MSPFPQVGEVYEFVWAKARPGPEWQHCFSRGDGTWTNSVWRRRVCAEGGVAMAMEDQARPAELIEKSRVNVDIGIDSRRADWRFDAQVAGSFDSHVRKSVPLYDQIQEAVIELSDWFVGRRSVVYDIGCASGTTLGALIPRHVGKEVSWVGIDEADPMLEEARSKLMMFPNVRLVCRAVPSREELIADASYVTSIFTLQFVPPRDRPAFVEQVYRGLVPGGAFVLVEKIHGDDPMTDGIFVELYHAFKRSQGFTAMQVVEKALSLRGVLVPDKAAEHERRLREAGFRVVDRFFGWMNWAGWVCIK